MKRRTRLTTLSFCLILLLTGCGSASNRPAGHGGVMATMNNEKEETAVKTMKATKGTISTEYMYSGTIKPKTEVDVLSSINGKVANVNFDVGDMVNEGDILFVMDTTDIVNSINVSKASVDSSEASVQTAKTNLELANGSSMQTQIENAKNSVTNTEKSLKNSEVSLNNAKISLDKSKDDYEANKLLFDAGVIAKENFDTYKNSYEMALNTYEQAKISYEQAQESLEQAKNNYEIVANQTPEENIRRAQDSLNQASAQKTASQAQLSSAQQSLIDANVKSPIKGTVLECNVTAGANLSQSTIPFKIIDIDTVNIEVNVSEQIINSIKIGDTVKIKLTSLSDEIFEGQISTISPGANADGTYNVKLEMDNNNGSLKSGMFAEVYFTKDKKDSTFVLPRSAVITKDNESYVFVTEGSKAQKVVVKTGIDNGEEIEITEGLSDNMMVVIKGQTYLKDGDEINDVTNDDNDKNIPSDLIEEAEK